MNAEKKRVYRKRNYREWTRAAAINYICAVNHGREKYGLKYLSAVDFLHLTLRQAAAL